MNEYLKNLNKLEFVITYACTVRCKHCSEGEHTSCGAHIDPDIAVRAIKSVASHYRVQTVMTFGGEPLLFPEAVYKIQRTALEVGVENRQVITNGCFSHDPKHIAEVAAGLSACKVNDVLLSVDAFHQEPLPLETVRIFAEELKKRGVPVRLQPAWLGGRDASNAYNVKTEQILASFSSLDIRVGSGNTVFPSGNAARYLSDYFDNENTVADPYVEDPFDVKTLSFDPDGTVLDGNAAQSDILDIIKAYKPKK